MRILAALSVLILVLSALLAPQVRKSRTAGPDPETLAYGDPHERIAHGETENALGLTYSGCEELLRADPNDIEALRGRIRSALLIAAAAPDRSDVPRLIDEQVTAYLDHREAIDPNGDLLQDILDRFVSIRLEHPSRFIRAAYAVQLAARGDERGSSRIDQYVREGPFEQYIFNLARLIHLNWIAVGPAVEHYLALDGKEALDGRVQAGLTLLEYNRIHGLGQELLDRNKDRIRASFTEVIAALGPVGDSREMMPMGVNAMQGLALLGEAQDIEAIRNLNPVRYSAFADLIRVVRIWVGLDPYSKIQVGGLEWKFLAAPARALYFRAGAHNFVRLCRVDSASLNEEDRQAHAAALEEARMILDAATIDSMSGTRVYANYMLAVGEPEEAPAHLRQVIAGGDATGIFAAVLSELEDPVPALLRGLISNEPEVVALTVVSLLRMDGPIPLQPYAMAADRR